MVALVTVALVSSEFVGASSELVAHVGSELALIVVMAHETVTVETSDAFALVASLRVRAVGVDMAVVLGHLTFVLVLKLKLSDTEELV